MQLVSLCPIYPITYLYLSKQAECLDLLEAVAAELVDVDVLVVVPDGDVAPLVPCRDAGRLVLDALVADLLPRPEGDDGVDGRHEGHLLAVGRAAGLNGIGRVTR